MKKKVSLVTLFSALLIICFLFAVSFLSEEKKEEEKKHNEKTEQMEEHQESNKDESDIRNDNKNEDLSQNVGLPLEESETGTIAPDNSPIQGTDEEKSETETKKDESEKNETDTKKDENIELPFVPFFR